MLRPALALSVCLSVCSHILKYMLGLAMVRARSSSDGNTVRYVLPGFVSVMFHRIRAKRPESKTTRMFRPVRQTATSVGRQTTLFGRVRYLAAGAGSKCAVCECILSEVCRAGCSAVRS